jgi:hypothetical protein
MMAPMFLSQVADAYSLLGKGAGLLIYQAAEADLVRAERIERAGLRLEELAGFHGVRVCHAEGFAEAVDFCLRDSRVSMAVR